MKTILLIPLYLWCLAYMAFGGTVRIGWDDQPGCDFKVWSGMALLKTSKDNTATITLPDFGISVIRVTAFVPGKYGESPPAEIVLVPYVVQESTDLINWPRATTLYFEQRRKHFVRVASPSITP